MPCTSTPTESYITCQDDICMESTRKITKYLLEVPIVDIVMCGLHTMVSLHNAGLRMATQPKALPYLLLKISVKLTARAKVQTSIAHVTVRY